MPLSLDGLILYITISLIYQSIFFPIYPSLFLSEKISGWIYFLWIAVIFVVPAAVGIISGLNIRKGWSKKFVNFLGIATINPISCAWDWHFGGCEECWVIATLKDDTKWYGYLGSKSFISSEPAERDIYIECVYIMEKDGQDWVPRNSSVLIMHGEIQTLEFLPR